jgi:hypothetical protein
MIIKFSDNLNDPGRDAFESMRNGQANDECRPRRCRIQDTAATPDGNRPFTIRVNSMRNPRLTVAPRGPVKARGHTLSVRLSGF